MLTQIIMLYKYATEKHLRIHKPESDGLAQKKTTLAYAQISWEQQSKMVWVWIPGPPTATAGPLSKTLKPQLYKRNKSKSLWIRVSGTVL